MPWRFEDKFGNIVKYIFPNNIYVVGRISADFIVNDKSVSRRHATVIWSNNQKFLEVEDLSKFGTFINKLPLENKRGMLKDGDIITFGAQPGVDFKCSIENFDIITSALFSNELQLLKVYLSVCGSNILKDWNENVEYLVMSNVKVTYKVVCGLIKQVNIVRIDFIKEMLDYFKGIRLVKPKPEEYIPQSTDNKFSDNNIFKVDLRRKTVFFNMTFYFMSKEKLMKLMEAIVSGGGKTILITDSGYTEESLKLCLSDPESVVMYETEQNSLVNLVYEVLKQIGKRPIIDAEIGFAVLCASTAEYCNPKTLCEKSIYSETEFSQVFNINPFHLHEEKIDESNRMLQSRKRSLFEHTNSEYHAPKRLKSSFMSTNIIKNQSMDQENVSISFQQPSMKQISVSSLKVFNDENKEKICNKPERKDLQLIQETETYQPNSSTNKYDNFSTRKTMTTSTNFESARVENKPENSILENEILKLNQINSMDQKSSHQNIDKFDKDNLYQKSKTQKIYSSNDTIKYLPMVKESYFANENCKKFKKISKIYISSDPIELFKYK